MTATALDRLFDPRSIVVVGASADPSKRGYQVINALRDTGYPHPVYAVNPRGGRILDLPVHTAVAELPVGIDLALVALPAPAVAEAVRQLAARSVAAAVVLANGFGEAGVDGAEHAAALADVIAATGIRVIGPNTSGILNVASGVNLVGTTDVPKGPISVVTQSGNIWLSLLADNRAMSGPGFHMYIGLGNQTDVRYHECVEQLAAQQETGVIALHVEGTPDGRALLVALADVSRRRPVVVLRGGRSDPGRRAALSHTGSIATTDAVATAAFAQAGAELVARSDEFALVAGVLATCPPVSDGRGVVIVSDGGGHAALAADALAAHGVPLAVLHTATRDRLRRLLGPQAAVDNPIDVAGTTDTDPFRFTEIIDYLLSDPAVGGILVVGLYGGYHLRFDARLREVEDDTSRRLADTAAWSGVPMLVQSVYAADHPHNHQILRDAGIPVIGSIDHAARALAALHRRGARLADYAERSDLVLPPPAGLPLPSGGGPLTEPAARTVLEAAGIDTGPWRLATSAAEAHAAVVDFGAPCALKIVSRQVPHKSDVGGVRLNVTPQTAASVWIEITDTVAARVPDAEIDGVLVTPMAPDGVELLIGATIDPAFGPIVAFGSGGVLVEATGDVAFRAAPLTHREAHELIAETTASRLLDGYRNLPSANRDQLADLLVQVGDFAACTPRLTELDLNPVIPHATGLTLVDARITLSPK